MQVTLRQVSLYQVWVIEHLVRQEVILINRDKEGAVAP